MRLKRLFTVAVEIGLAGMVAVAAVAQTAAPPANWSKAGCRNHSSLKYLQKNDKPADLTPDNMVRLKAAGISETVIGVMLDPTSAPAVTPAPQAEAPPAVAEPGPVATNGPAPVASSPAPESSDGLQGANKQIYFFKNLKVTFVEGKVTDIE